MIRWIAALAGLTFFASACGSSSDGGNPEASPQLSTSITVGAATSSPVTTAVTTSIRPPSAEHRIGTRTGSNGPELFDRITGDTWVARGFNQWQWTLTNGYLMDQTFRTGSNRLDEAKADLDDMASYGYNTVRTWIDACFDSASGCLVGRDGAMQSEYLDNMAEYLRTARDLGIQVILTTDDINGGGKYGEGKVDLCCDEWSGFNLRNLTGGGVSDQVAFWTDLVSGLMDAGAPMDAILAFELRNEHFFEADQPPYGVLDSATTANGETYDLTNPAETKRMEDAGLLYWAETLSKAIKAVDPSALVTVGFFSSSQAPSARPNTDTRIVDPTPLLTSDAIDFIDIHEYAGLGPGGWDAAWGTSFLDDNTTKPILLGEFGAFVKAFGSVEEAITSDTSWIGRACRAGIDGFLSWTWDNKGVYSETWDGVSEDHAIAKALSPGEFPDPCDDPPPLNGNIAFERPTTGSLWEDSDEFYAPPSNAVDGSVGSWWTAPDVGPQWITIDLREPSTINRVRLLTDLGADAAMRIKVDLSDENGVLVASQVFDVPVGSDNAITLEHVFDDPPMSVKTVRVTTERDGWIIWNEIEVYGSATN